MKPVVVADEMFPEGPYDCDEAMVGSSASSSVQMMDIAANEKAVHSEFFNSFDDLCDDDDLE